MAMDRPTRRLRCPEGEPAVGAVMAAAAVSEVKGFELDRGRLSVVAAVRLEYGVQTTAASARLSPVMPVDVRDAAARVSSVIEVPGFHGPEAEAVGGELLRAENGAAV